MDANSIPTWIAFASNKRLASGTPRDVAGVVKRYADENPDESILVFDLRTSTPIELDLRGSLSAVLRRLPPETSNPSLEAQTTESTTSEKSPGRPKLGVVAREVTLLPRHWDWLAAQPGGASVALRKLVEQARKTAAESDRRRQAVEATNRFMTAMAGDNAGYEEACRALFAGDIEALRRRIARWPVDIRSHVLMLAEVGIGKASEEAHA